MAKINDRVLGWVAAEKKRMEFFAVKEKQYRTMLLMLSVIETTAHSASSISDDAVHGALKNLADEVAPKTGTL